MSPRVTAVVPTLGESPWLGRCLGALRRDAGEGLEIVLVHPGPGAPDLEPGLVDQEVRTEGDLGFAAATNLGIARCGGEFIATVNDDALVEPGWSGALLAALAARPGVAAVQGVNLELARPARVDGWGLAWNRAWQAVQLGRGERPPDPGGEEREIFGVSATAALYRRSALLAVAGPGGEVFDPRLVSYYEDVDLACRLRGAGYRAMVVPRARALHAGSATGRLRNPERLRLIYGNRLLVLARFLGRAFWPRLPAALWRDARDLGQALLRRDRVSAGAVLAGWGRALGLLPAFARGGRPGVPLSEVRRLQVRSRA